MNKPRDGCDGCNGKNDTVKTAVAIVATVAEKGRQCDLPRPSSPSKTPQSLRWMWAEDYAQELSANKPLTTPVFAVCIHTANRKPGRGFRRSRIPPRRAHDTLQPQDESIIVGYYTSAEVPPRKLSVLHNLKSGGKLPMARGDGIHRTTARNARMKDTDIDNAQAHNEREKSSYVNQNIVPERTPYNVHFKTPTAGYKELFEQMRSDGVISTRGLKADAEKFGELIFDVNSAYFFNHGGYEFAKQFYADAYKAAIKIVGGEQYPVGSHARRRAQPCHVRRTGAGCVPLPPSCGLYSCCGKANLVVETL